jgi:hypothetical protein
MAAAFQQSGNRAFVQCSKLNSRSRELPRRINHCWRETEIDVAALRGTGSYLRMTSSAQERPNANGS